MTIHRLLGAAALCALAAAASARPVVDQESPYGTDTIRVGGSPNFAVAQVVRAGVTGDLMRVEVGVGCESGSLTIDIVNLDGRHLPGPAVRSTVTIDAAGIPMPPEPRTFDLDRWPSMMAGHEFAIVLRNPTGTCTALKSNAFDAYPEGHAWFRREPTTGGWLQFLDFGAQDDLGFRTIVNVVPPTPRCVVNGFRTQFSADLPVCRCISDEGLNDFRCGLFHPDFFLFRNIPLPVVAGKPFEVKWTLVVLAKMDGVIELLDQLPPGFTGAPKAPLTFFVSQVPVGQSITLGYEAVAPLKAGKFKVESEVVGQGKIETVLEVK